MGVGCGVIGLGVLYDHTVCVYTMYFQNMQLHVGGLGELAEAELTCVGSFPSVTEHVAVQLGGGDKPFPTHIALMFVVWGKEIILDLRRIDIERSSQVSRVSTPVHQGSIKTGGRKKIAQTFVFLRREGRDT